jgi:hypothetical protein
MQASLTYREIRFIHVADQPVPVLGHPGSMVRGVFGHALKTVLCPFSGGRDEDPSLVDVSPMAVKHVDVSHLDCVNEHFGKSALAIPEPDCLRCVHAGQCLYADLFMQLSQRTAAGGGTPKAMLQRERSGGEAVRSGHADQWPAPYVLDSSLSSDGKTLVARLVLFGHAVRHIEKVVKAIRGMSAIGFGNARWPMCLEELLVDGREVSSDATEDTWLPARSWKLEQPAPVATSVRLRFGGTLLKSRERRRQTDPLAFDVLMRALLRRQSLLAVCHEQPWELPFGMLVTQAREVRLAGCRLMPFQWQRTSSRTGQTSRYDAFCGEVTYEGNLSPFIPFLLLGTHTHVGSGTVFGMGKFTVDLLA